jgi:hypothetical protein
MEFTRERAGALLLGGDVAEAASIGGYILAIVNGEDAGEFPIDAVLTVGVGAAVVFAAARAVGARTIVGPASASPRSAGPSSPTRCASVGARPSRITPPAWAAR